MAREMIAGATLAVRVVGVVGDWMALLMCLLFGEMLETAAAIGKGRALSIVPHRMGQ
jgi:hypothetical protein